MNYHGLSYHPLYGTWRRLVQRCTNPNDPAYYNYGGRGLTVFPAWLEVSAFINYIEVELGPKPSSVHTIDRVDNDLGYLPGNLRWATRSEQNSNQRQRVCDGYPMGSSGARGIRYIEKTGHYQARIHRGGDKTIGTYLTLEEAVAARQAALT